MAKLRGVGGATLRSAQCSQQDWSDSVHHCGAPADGHGKFAAGGHAAHAHVQQRLDHARDEAFVEVAVPQLPSSPCTGCTRSWAKVCASRTAQLRGGTG